MFILAQHIFCFLCNAYISICCFTSALPAPIVTTEVNSTVITGSEHSLDCIVQEIPNLVVQPMLEWLGPEGSVLANGSGLSLNTTISRVKTSDAGQYTCRAIVTVEVVGVLIEGINTTIITVQSESSRYLSVIKVKLSKFSD